MAPQARAVPIVAVGASAGGVSALTTLVHALPPDLAAAVLVVLHIAPSGPSLLPAILDRASALPAAHAVDGDEVATGHIYVAPPDRHLLLDGSRLRVARTPRENGVRPAVDSLFRTVAKGRGRRAIGIVLSGTLDDGTAGLAAIGEAGGRTVVQDPDEAVFPGMPASAVRFANPEFVVPLAEMGPLIGKLVHELPPPAPAADGDPPEAGVDALPVTDRRTPSPFTCPDCGGTLFEQESDELLHFRCRVGHRYSVDALLVEQQSHLESALYSAVVAMEERADLSRRLGRRMEQLGRSHVARRYFTHADETEQHALVVRDAVSTLGVAPEDRAP